jgi:anti-anti-sigma regulatory factor
MHIQNLVIFSKPKIYQMNVKIDTKEKFAVITPVEEQISANMTGELTELLLHRLTLPVPHVVINLENVKEISPETAGKMAETQRTFYEKNCSFVICGIMDQPRDIFIELELLSDLNTTPTESEAWDIIQMEEIERDLMSGHEGTGQ